MTVRFELPREIEQSLRQSVADLDQAAKEATVVELYRQQKLTQHEMAAALEISRLEVDELLKRHGVTEDLPTPNEIEQDLQELRRLLRK